ncbi:MAG: NAAT family transporter [Deltaproteobacteria bacterium]|nr:NAAT family transporter [Deltaproteobacteria bacterium]
MEYALFLLKCATGIFVIINPFGILGIVLSLIAHVEPDDRARTLSTASTASFLLLVVFALGGQVIMQIFQISLGALRIAAGLFLFSMSISMLYGTQPRAELNDADRREADEKDDIAITPLGIPIITGPGCIATVMSLNASAPDIASRVLVFVAILIAVTASHLVLRSGQNILKFMGRNGLRVMTRLMGLLVAVMASQMVINGLYDAFPGLAGTG